MVSFMTRLLRNLRLWQKIVLIIASFVLPVGVLAFFTFQSFEENINITRLEKDGTALGRRRVHHGAGLPVRCRCD